jgi:hypothetical protein
MYRGAALTLGAIVTLAGLAASRADDLSLFDWPALSWAPLSMQGIFPKPPENWSELPVQFHISETAGYNSNITNTPTGAGAASLNFARPIGSLVSISTYGASFKNEISGQQFFADANWGVYRYLDAAVFNTTHSSVDIGDNFTLGPKCAGTLKLSEATAPSLPGQQVGTNVVNNVTTLDATENAKCIISGEYSGIFNSGISNSTNSAFLDKFNDFQSVFIAAGVSYAVSETNSLQVLATVTGRDFTNRQLVASQTQLVNNLLTDEIMATYTKNLGPTLSLSAQYGLLGFRDTSFRLVAPHTILPQYSLSLQWVATPKLSFNAAASRLASAPTSIISNLQITESASLGANYRLTPKLSVGGTVQASYLTGAATTFINNGLINVFASNERTYSASAKLDYVITPFLAANLSYQFTKTVQSSLTTTDNLILLALNFNPY